MSASVMFSHDKNLLQDMLAWLGRIFQSHIKFFARILFLVLCYLA